MPRKRRRKYRPSPNRVAPTFVTPFVGTADVRSIIDSETWTANGRRKLFRALLYAAFAVLAACARVRPRNATYFLLADYEADRLQARRRGRSPYLPVILLPVTVAVIEAYLAHRRHLGIGGAHLLVDEAGGQLNFAKIYIAFAGFMERRGHPGGKAIERLIEFHDIQLSKETRDPAACVVLRGGRRGSLDKGHAKADIDAAAGDRERLTRVLARNHALANRPTGGRVRAEARKHARLFLPTRSRTYRLSPAVRTDPVCARLLALDWIGSAKAQRKKIIDEDLQHLVGLLDKGVIVQTDIAFLLNVSLPSSKEIVKKHRLSLETAEERLARERYQAEWREKAIALYAAKPSDEALPAFFGRIANEERYPFPQFTLIMVLMHAGVLPAQVARRQKRRTSGLAAKSGKTELRSGKSGVTGGPGKVSERSKTQKSGVGIPKTLDFRGAGS